MNKRDFFKTLTTAAIVAPVAIAASGLSDKSSAPVKESAYARVMRTRVLKAGWFEEPPFTLYNPNTQARTGIVPRIVERFCADYEWTVEWVTISNFAMMGADLASGKYDAICASMINMPRGGIIDSINPFVFVPTFAYVRADEKRFTSLAQFNDASVVISGQDGTAVTAVARQKFPKAQHYMANSADLVDMFVSVATKKADVAFMIPSFYDEYNKHNPGVLKQMGTAALQLFSFSFGVQPEQEGLKSLMNNSLHRMMVSGEMDEVFAEFDPGKTLLRPIIAHT